MKKVLIIGALLMLSTGTVRAETIDPKAREVLEKLRASSSDIDYSKCKSYYCETERLECDNAGKVTKKTKGFVCFQGKQSRSTSFEYDMSGPGERLVREAHGINDGTNAWEISSDGGRRKIKKRNLEEELRSMVPATKIDVSKFEEPASETKKSEMDTYYIDYAGKESANGVICHILEYGKVKENKKISDFKLWICADTYDVMKSNFGNMEMLTTDYRVVKGVRIPFYVEWAAWKTRTITLKIDEPLPADLFNPDSIKVAVIPKTKEKTEETDASLPVDQVGKETPAEISAEAGEDAVESESTDIKKEVAKEVKKEIGRKVLKGFLGLP